MSGLSGSTYRLEHVEGEIQAGQVVLDWQLFISSSSLFFDLIITGALGGQWHLLRSWNKKKLQADWALDPLRSKWPNTFTIMCPHVGQFHTGSLWQMPEKALHWAWSSLKKVKLEHLTSETREPQREYWSFVGLSSCCWCLGYFVYFNHNLICFFAFAFEISVWCPEPVSARAGLFSAHKWPAFGPANGQQKRRKTVRSSSSNWSLQANWRESALSPPCLFFF